jgi:hypothetical protein
VMKTVRQWLNMSITRPLSKREEWAPSFEHILHSTPRTDTPKTLPLSAEAQKQWPSYLKARHLAAVLSDAEIEALPDGPTARHPLSDLQIDVCTVAARAFDDPTSVTEIQSWNQAQGAKFLRKQKAKLLIQKQKIMINK